MRYANQISQKDATLARKLQGFVPREIFDIHAHPYHPDHFTKHAFSFLPDSKILGCCEHREALRRYMPASTIHGLYFGMPHRTADRKALNRWVLQEVGRNGSDRSRALKLISPEDDAEETRSDLIAGRYCGLKVYHIYSGRADSMQASIVEYAPEWMWEILHDTGGVMMLHIVRDGAIEDTNNQSEIRRLSRKYPNMKLILAHVARSFNYRHARNGLDVLADLDNVVIDTSAICETESFRIALKGLGPRRILWGSDFAVSEMRGRCVATGEDFFWLHPEILREGHQPPTSHEMTLVGLESLTCLREACEDFGLNQKDIEDIFLNNSIRLLATHSPPVNEQIGRSGPELWRQSRAVISGGTGLLSKRAEMFGTPSWPTYFSRCSGCEVWDLDGRRYIDFAGGIGAVLLGYADPDVSQAVERRLLLGTYCSLVTPDEVELARRLLLLHPWAGKVRYARGGGEAMAVAVRIARSATGKSGIAFCGYHGWQDWYLAANIGDTHALDGHLLPGLNPAGVPRELKGTSKPFRYNDISSLETALKELDGNLAAVVMEPMRSEKPRDNFVQRVAERCRDAGAVFIIDEITSGMRFGFPGAHVALNVTPDIAVYAKALSNGFPFAAIVGSEQVMVSADESFISSSYWTDGVGPAAALAVLEKMQRLNINEILWSRGVDLSEKLNALSTSFPQCGLAIGGMPVSPTLNFRLGEDSMKAKSYFCERMLAKGFLVSSILYLMYAHEDRHVEGLLQAMNVVLAEMEPMVTSGNLRNVESQGESHGFARLA